MSKRDRAVIAVLIVASLVAGLFVVRFAVRRAQANQDSAMSQAISNMGQLPEDASQSDKEEENAEELGDDAQGELSQGEEQPKEQARPEDSEADGQAASAPQAGGQESQMAEGQLSGAIAAAQTNAALLEALEAGSFSDPALLEELGLLGEVRPSMGDVVMTEDSFSLWIQNESLEALAADAALQAAQAVAVGVGNTGDAQLRAYAGTQGEANRQAERNRLAESAFELSMSYLSARDILTAREDTLACAQLLEQAVEEQKEQAEQEMKKLQDMQPDAQQLQAHQDELRKAQSRFDQVGADLEQAGKFVLECQTALDESQAALEQSAQSVQLAAGNPVTMPLTFTGTLVKGTVPSGGVDGAVAQAMENRNELKQAAYDIIRAEQQYNALRYEYAPDSPQLLEQQTAWDEAQAKLLVLKGEIEIDIRRQYSDMHQLAREMENLSTSEIALSGQYELKENADGFTTNLSVLIAELNSSSEKVILNVNETVRLNRMILQFEHAVGVGVISAAISA